MKKYLSSPKLVLTVCFILLGLLSLQIPLTRVLGSGSKFTLFDFLAPTLGVFLTTVPGILAVLTAQILNILLHGGRPEAVSFIRLFPLLFGVFYFSKKRTANLLIPLAAIIAFNLHPIGRSAWPYSLFWLIPVFSHFFRKDLFIRSLGTAFAAHGVGSALWVWSMGLNKEMWLALIPQTAVERTIMAGGICVFYVIFSYLLNFASQQRLLFHSYK